MSANSIRIDLDAVRVYRNKSEYRTTQRARSSLGHEVIGDDFNVAQLADILRSENPRFEGLLEGFRGMPPASPQCPLNRPFSKAPSRNNFGGKPHDRQPLYLPDQDQGSRRGGSQPRPMDPTPRNRLLALVSTSEAMAAEEASRLDAIRRQMLEPKSLPWADRPCWASIQIRIDQMAIIEMLQARHLKVTEKEISRAEVLAALLAEGLERIINHSNFEVCPVGTATNE